MLMSILIHLLLWRNVITFFGKNNNLDCPCYHREFPAIREEPLTRLLSTYSCHFAVSSPAHGVPAE